MLISNPAETGVTINFAVDGSAYNVPSGYTQRLIGTTSSIVEFDRGDLFGDGRYHLSDGSYEFRYTDRGWELYKKPVNPPVPTSGSISQLPKNVPPRNIASAVNGGPPIVEVVPPPPGPGPLAPR